MLGPVDAGGKCIRIRVAVRGEPRTGACDGSVLRAPIASRHRTGSVFGRCVQRVTRKLGCSSHPYEHASSLQHTARREHGLAQRRGLVLQKRGLAQAGHPLPQEATSATSTQACQHPESEGRLSPVLELSSCSVAAAEACRLPFSKPAAGRPARTAHAGRRCVLVSCSN